MDTVRIATSDQQRRTNTKHDLALQERGKAVPISARTIMGALAQMHSSCHTRFKNKTRCIPFVPIVGLRPAKNKSRPKEYPCVKMKDFLLLKLPKRRETIFQTTKIQKTHFVHRKFSKSI
jgi:hypothetical protein